ncbi:Coenzyme A transferase [Paenibacillus sp. UNCCL117]|uniref:CoA-transferase n=1 Tax=unclassified Paenibacillus TaxID=185978 RepID=UPI000887D2CA|nr:MULTISPECIES: CoA-transferase [unclassified Paenibacillus]SDE28636.1 Coenzyme A transferase [Paenibacillus sp. cl123]SFW63435.1 Coenzyme A transferase [Paenibacillus sp. UNCCL117]
MTSRTVYSREEWLICLLARQLRSGETIGVGNQSPVPAAAALLAQELHAPGSTAYILGQPDWPFEGTEEFFAYMQRGGIDVFFLSGAQIDAYGNINLHAIGGYGRPKVRLPGGAGSGVVNYVCRRILLFKTDHGPKGFPEKLDFVSSAAYSAPQVFRRGRVEGVFTPLGVLRPLWMEGVSQGIGQGEDGKPNGEGRTGEADGIAKEGCIGEAGDIAEDGGASEEDGMDGDTVVQRRKHRLRLAAVAPGVTPADVQAQTGFDLGLGPWRSVWARAADTAAAAGASVAERGQAAEEGKAALEGWTASAARGSETGCADAEERSASQTREMALEKLALPVVEQLEPPTELELTILRTAVRAKLERIYPLFARQSLG